MSFFSFNPPSFARIIDEANKMSVKGEGSYFISFPHQFDYDPFWKFEETKKKHLLAVSMEFTDAYTPVFWPSEHEYLGSERIPFLSVCDSRWKTPRPGVSRLRYAGHCEGEPIVLYDY